MPLAQSLSHNYHCISLYAQEPYLPEAWFDDLHKLLWDQCDIPEETEFRTKPQLALEMIQKAVKNNDFNFKWVGCDGAFGCDSEFRKDLPESTLFFTAF